MNPTKYVTFFGKISLLFFIAGIINIAFASEYKSKPITEILQQIDLSKTTHQLRMGIATFKPNTIKPSQMQNGPEVLYVLNGDVTYYAKGKSPKHLNKGESYQIPAGEIHYSQAGKYGAKILAAWVLDKNIPFIIYS